jgi:DNA-binding Lrp family transcriptional regulator
MSVGAYVLAHFTDSEKLLPAAQLVNRFENVVRWNAVEGHAHLVVKLDKPSQEIPRQIIHLDGIDSLQSYDIEEDNDKNINFDPSLSYSYLFIEVEPIKSESVRKFLIEQDEILFCSRIKGGCDFVAVIKSKTFEDINRRINENIRTLDGILRLKQDRIIDLTKF